MLLLKEAFKAIITKKNILKIYNKEDNTILNFLIFIIKRLISTTFIYYFILLLSV